MCLPRAGGTARDFAPWAETFGSEIQLAAVQLPGRLERFRERAIDRCAPIAAEVAAIARGFEDLPLILFGDCMGTLIAYEVARKMRHDGIRLPAALIVASYPAPDHPRNEPPYHAAPLEELRARLARIGGVPRELLQDNEMFRLMLPTLRADFSVFERYKYNPEPPLPIDVHAIIGAEDTLTSAAHLEGWERHTSARFALRVFAGGHFFLRESEDVPRFVRDVALAATQA
jgi:surfactin synthase thioesterase subunit